ncbi:MAG TPA: hypothetical protein VGN63_01975 [Flavisolibacter sp.]|nr:hypothetical protein [Flavisolibacter sp.]
MKIQTDLSPAAIAHNSVPMERSKNGTTTNYPLQKPHFFPLR